MDLWQILGIVLSALVGVGGLSIKMFNEVRDARDKHSKAKGKFDSAKEDYIRALEAEKPQILSRSGGVKERPNIDDPGELRGTARDLLREALEIGPDRKTKAQIYYYQVRMLYDEKISNKDTGDYCIEKLKDALKLDRQLGIAYELRGQILEEFGRKEQALQDYNRYGRLDPYDDKTQLRIERLKKEIGIVEKPTIWQKWHSMTGRTRLCMSLA